MIIEIPVPVGSRNTTLFTVGKYLKEKQAGDIDIFVFLEMFDRLLSEKPLGFDEFDKIIRSVTKLGE